MYCWSCNYPLTGLASTRCPECGRVFDPQNPATMNLREPIGRLARLILAPVSLATLALALVGCILVLVVTRLPLAPINTWFLDFRYYLRKPDLTRLTWRDTAYMLGLLFSALALAAWLLGTIARQVAQRKYQPPKSQRPRTPLRHLLLFLLLTITTIATGGAWPYRYGQILVAEQLRTSVNASGTTPLLAGSISYDLGVIRSALRHSRTPRQRTAATKLAVEQWASHPSLLQEAASRETDEQVLALQLRLLGLHRNIAFHPFLEQQLQHAAPIVRSAGLDALASTYDPGNVFDQYADSIFTNSDPPIHVRAIMFPNQFRTKPEQPPPKMPPALQSRLREIMISDTSSEVRQAAARALVPYPPENYKLRIAEWGVWSAEGGHLKPVAPVTADLPPFVHPTGDPIVSTDPRINRFYAIRKPVLHITASAPMSLDLQVLINQGRPWFAYPLPDDYAVQADRGRGGKGLTPLGIQLQKNPRPLAPLDFPTTLPTKAAALTHQPTTLPSPHTGYPWLLPAHPQSIGDAITQMGLRWQSIIVSPEKLPWMAEPTVPNNEKYNWWKRLRNTNCSWLSSRDEAERFLYYDGPTLLQFPIDARMDNGELVLVRPKNIQPPDEDAWRGPPRQALFITVKDNTRDARLLAFPIGRGWELRPPLKPLPTDKTIEIFQQLLTDRGLSKEEAAALSDCWQSEFFQTQGQRLLIFLTKEDYDHFCPITIRPKPTTLTRVGIIWLELPEPRM